MTNEQFIEKAIEIHGYKYDYSLVEYIDNNTCIKIYCKKCKDYFIQKPKHHLYSKSGCQRCSKNYRIDTNEFIKKSIEKFGDKYNYSLLEYKNMHTNIQIICKEHGIFEKNPVDFLNSGCNKCSKRISDTLKFIEESKEINGDKYDYSLTEYVSSRKKVKLICKEHNYIFEQTPNNHICKKQGCDLCGNKNRRLKRIQEISINKYNGNQVIPSFNSLACDIFNNIMINENVYIQHAMNGGEYYIAELGYWLDGYDKDNNIVYEYDEKHHFDKYGNLLEKDIIRQNEIEIFLFCKFIRIKYN